MRHSVENHRLRISINQVGAELCSLVNLDSGREYMWQADPDVWGSHAPVLFPMVGRLKDGKTEIGEKTYRIPKHGFLRGNEHMEVFYHSEDGITFRLPYSEETLKMYPYEFDFRITFRLRNEHVIVYYEIHNLGDEPMHFCLGGHPAFRVPLYDHDPYDGHFLRFEHEESAERHLVTKAGNISRSTRPVDWQAGGVLPLSHELFATDALVFRKLNSRSVTLESKINGPLLKVDYAGWTHLGIWAKPNGDFVCIEPWLGMADYEDGDGIFKNKEGIVGLAAGEVFEMSYDIKVL
jgi:galactose mutarotase-like enzyme